MSAQSTSRLKVNAPIGEPPTLEWKAVGQLIVDPVYQRSIEAKSSQNLINRIATFWDWGLCQPLAIARRPDGSLAVVDGQHRLEAAKRRRDIPHLPCVITAYRDEGDEAAAFVALNRQRRSLSKLDLFKAALAAEDDAARKLAAIITSAGLTLAPHQNCVSWKPGMISHIGGIERAVGQHGEEIAGAALGVLAEAFEGKVQQFAGTIYPGIVGVLKLHREAWDGEGRAKLGKALSRRSQQQWRVAITHRMAAAGERRERAAQFVVQRAFDIARGLLTDITAVPPEAIAGIGDRFEAAPAAVAPTDMAPAEMAWCDQCDQRRSGAQAAKCTDRFCALKESAAA